MIKNLLLALVLTANSVVTLGQQTISGTFSPAEKYSFGILYMIDVNNVFYRVDSSIKDGKFSVETKEDLVPGMYRFVYDLPQTENFFDFIYNGKEGIEFSFSDVEGVVFTESEENKLWYQYKLGMDTFEQDINLEYAEENISKKKIKRLFEMQNELHTSLKTQAKGTLAEKFIAAYTPYIPSTFETASDYQNNKKIAFFKGVDFGNSLLQKSGLPLEMIIKYVFNYVEGDDEMIARQANVDEVASQIANQSSLFQKSVLDNLWQFLVNNNQVEMANYLATKHLFAIAGEANDTALVNKLYVFKSLSIGEKAPNFSWEEDIEGKTYTKSLQEQEDAENYIIVFWSSLCSHCLKEVPKLHTALKNTAEGKFKVIAVGLEDEPYDWQNTIFDMPDFTHVLGLGKWENKIGNDYDVSATPTYFVLDAELRIAEKPETIEDLMKIINLEE